MAASDFDGFLTNFLIFRMIFLLFIRKQFYFGPKIQQNILNYGTELKIIAFMIFASKITNVE